MSIILRAHKGSQMDATFPTKRLVLTHSDKKGVQKRQ